MAEVGQALLSSFAKIKFAPERASLLWFWAVRLVGKSSAGQWICVFVKYNWTHILQFQIEAAPNCWKTFEQSS